MKLNILTWNTGLTETPNDMRRCDKILDYVYDFLEKENSIAFLQQIAYKDKQNNWKSNHILFEKLMNKFKERYEVVYYKKSLWMMTVAITKRNNTKGNDLYLEDDAFYPEGCPRNRSVAVKFNGLSFLAIHAQNGNYNKSFLKSISGKADVVLGDFNAGDYLESENRDVFNGILREHICICNMPTKITESGRRTCIDHIFVRENLVTKCGNLIVDENTVISDHFPISFEINT